MGALRRIASWCFGYPEASLHGQLLLRQSMSYCKSCVNMFNSVWWTSSVQLSLASDVV